MRKVCHSFPTRFLALFLTLFLLLACRPPDSAQPTTVTFAYFGDPAEQAAFISVVEGFHATSPQNDGVPIRIETIAVPSQSDYLTRLTTDFAAGAPPDVSLFNYRRMTQYYNRGALEVLDGRAQESTVLDLGGFYPAALDAFRNSAGEVVCLPQNISSQVVYYNKALFDAAGLAYPAPGWSWQAFRQTALALTF